MLQIETKIVTSDTKPSPENVPPRHATVPASEQTGALDDKLARWLDSERTRLLGLSRQVGTPTDYLRQTYPRLADVAPPELTEQELTQETLGWYEASERRLGLCAGCPPHGGGCERDGFGPLDLGLVPGWSDRAPSRGPCKRWEAYLKQQRLERSGVPTDLARQSLGLWQKDLSDEALSATVEFAEHWQRDAWLLVVGPVASEVAAATLRMTLEYRPRMFVRWVSLFTVAQQLREYSRNQSLPSPMPSLQRHHLLLIDCAGVLPDHEWINDTISNFLLKRYRSRRSLILAHPGSEHELFERYVTLPSLDVPIVKVG
jgi:hypothetical protein